MQACLRCSMINPSHRMALFIGGIALALLLLPLGMRFFFTQHTTPLQTFPLGSQPYIHLLLVQQLHDGTAPALTGRTIPVHPFHYLLAFVSQGNHGLLKAGIIIIPLLCGLVSLLLISYLFSVFGVGGVTKNMALLALLLSPAFLFTFTVAGSDAFAIAVLLAGAAAFVSSSRFLPVLGAVLLLFSATFSLFHALLILFFLGLYLFSCNMFHKKVLATISLFSVLLVILVAQHPFYVPYHIVPLTINMMVSDFGSISGLSLFFVILFFTGLVVAWKEKRIYAPLYLLVLFLTPAIVLYPQLLIYFACAAAFFVGKALSYFKESSWHFRSVGKITLFVIILGLLFSSLSYATRLKESSPLADQISGLVSLDEYAPSDSVVLSVPEMGYFIEYFAQRPVLLDESLSEPLHARRLKDADTIFHSRNLDETSAVLVRNNINFIVITKDMKTGGVWDHPDEGLLFLLRDSETFKNIYAAPSLEIWEVIP